MYNMHNIDKIKTNFQEILGLHNELLTVNSEINDSISKLKENYNELIKVNNKKIFLFCLDSFYFQYKILTTELTNLSQILQLLNNRIYGDYYKLYNIIISQSKENNIFTQSMNSETDKFPVYKDLEPFHQYKMSDIINIHNDIVLIINDLYELYISKQKNIHNYSDSTNLGITISNFINTLEYENSMLRELIELFSRYISFFHSSQKNNLNKLLAKMNIFKKELVSDILINYKNVKSIQFNNIMFADNNIDNIGEKKYNRDDLIIGINGESITSPKDSIPEWKESLETEIMNDDKNSETEIVFVNVNNSNSNNEKNNNELINE
jgi:hypothetical protein